MSASCLRKSNEFFIVARFRTTQREKKRKKRFREFSANCDQGQSVCGVDFDVYSHAAITKFLVTNGSPFLDYATNLLCNNGFIGD